MPKISQIVAREILDSRGNPTVEASVLLESGAFGTGSAPSGASTGKYEAVELRDEDPSRYNGKGVLNAVNNIRQKIAPELKGMDARDQVAVDEKLKKIDGSKNKENLGANAIVAVSIATAKAAALYSQRPLFMYLSERFNHGAQLRIPHSTFNIINGGKHGAGNLDFQEFHIVPSTRYSFSQSLQIAVETYANLKAELIHRNAIHSIGDEGGFAPDLFTNTDALELLSLVIRNSRYKLHQDIFLALDVASNSFFREKKYHIKDSPKPLDQKGMIDLYTNLVKNYNLFSIEDPLEEGDWNGWAELKKLLPPNILLVGDDLLTTHPERLMKAIESDSCNAILVKPNQIGTVTETVEVMNIAKQHNIYTVVSHRSGETNDTFIADFAVGLGANFTKFGAPVRGERVAKYNRLLEIEQYLSSY